MFCRRKSARRLDPPGAQKDAIGQSGRGIATQGEIKNLKNSKKSCEMDDIIPSCSSSLYSIWSRAPSCQYIWQLDPWLPVYLYDYIMIYVYHIYLGLEPVNVFYFGAKMTFILKAQTQNIQQRAIWVLGIYILIGED